MEDEIYSKIETLADKYSKELNKKNRRTFNGNAGR